MHISDTVDPVTGCSDMVLYKGILIDSRSHECMKMTPNDIFGFI